MSVHVSASGYWAEQMAAGAAFVERVLAHPVEDDGEALVDLGEAARRAGVELACSQEPHVRGRPRLPLLRASLVEPLLAAAAELRAIDHTLRVEDAFRTREMQRDLALDDEVLGQLVLALRRIEPDAAPDAIARQLAVVVAARPKGAGHMAGAAVDVSVLDPDGRPLDRGGPYLTVSERMPMDSPFVSDAQARNRRLVAELMERHGFAAYPFEFWHFSRDDAFDRVVRGDARPARYGPLELLPGGGAVPAADPLAPLNSDVRIAERLKHVLAHLSRSSASRGPSASS